MNSELPLSFGGSTMAHPIGISALLLCSFIVLFYKKWAVIPAILILIFAIPSGQRIVIFSLDFSFIRIVILLALIRAWVSGERKGQFHAKTDTIILLWMVWSIVAYGLLNNSFSAIVTRSGYMIDAVGSYFIGRIYMRTWGNMKQVILFAGYASILIAAFFYIEYSTARNMFSIFGGIPEFTDIREGRVRCVGPFSHPIMAGLFWATMLPWIAILWQRKEVPKLKLIIMITTITTITILTASSTPIMAIILCLIGLIFFRFRRFTPEIRALVFMALIAAQIVMEKGAAHLLARVNIVGGSTGWHRYHLIDQAIKNFNEWWLIGITSTEHWGWGLQDITNQYILEGTRSGIIGLILFILFLTTIFKQIGKAINEHHNVNNIATFWCSGIVIFVHLISFLSVSYFGQMVASFFLFAGIIVSISYLKLETEKTDN